MALTSIIEWPDRLGEPSIGGWQEIPIVDVIRFKADNQSSIVRRRSSRIGAIYSIQLIMRNEDYNVLYSFFHNTLSGGVLCFNWTHPYSSVKKTVRFYEGNIRFSAVGPLAMSARFRLEVLSSA